MKELVKMVAVLTVICAVAGILLALVNQATSTPIARALQAEKAAAIKQVLPPIENDPVADAVTVDTEPGPRTFFVGRRAGRIVGVAFTSTSAQGYGGDIDVMIGVNADGNVEGIRILTHKETPGLGARITEPSFLGRFAGRPIEGTDWRVAKDGGPIDEITAATISSRAVAEAVRNGLALYREHRATIVSAHPAPRTP